MFYLPNLSMINNIKRLIFFWERSKDQSMTNNEFIKTTSVVFY